MVDDAAPELVFELVFALLEVPLAVLLVVPEGLEVVSEPVPSAGFSSSGGT